MAADDREAALRSEADDLLRSGLRDALAQYGAVSIVGSYALRLMVWRDLDIELVPPSFDRSAFFTLGARIAELLKPVRMSYRDEIIAGTAGLPRGLYWGVYLGNERQGAWKIDIWAVDAQHCEASRRAMQDLVDRLKPAGRKAILRIKAEAWNHPGYRRSFTSQDIYEAVLDYGIADSAAFWEYLRQRNVSFN